MLSSHQHKMPGVILKEQTFTWIHALSEFQAIVTEKKWKVGSEHLFLTKMLTGKQRIGSNKVLGHNTQRPASCGTPVRCNNLLE